MNCRLIAILAALIVGALFALPPAAQAQAAVSIELSAQTKSSRAVTKGGGSCDQECKNSKCKISCPTGKEPICYCSQNDYAICHCEKPDTKRRPRTR